MSHSLSKRLFIAFLVLILGSSAVFYYYKISQIPEVVAQYAEKYINVDSLRFIFKVSALSQKGLHLYLDALVTRNQDSYDNAVDNFNAALAFLNISYTRNEAFEAEVAPKLKRILALIEGNKVDAPEAVITEIKNLVEQVFLLSASQEKEVWRLIQANYINAITADYKLSEVYKILTISLFTLILLGMWHLIRQNKLLREIRQNKAELAQLAYYDTLTQLPNRKHIESRLAQQLQQAKHASITNFIALIDIDDFKRVNDLLGHAAGDCLLQEVAQRLHAVIRVQDVLGRLGGDEFLLVFGHPITQDVLLSTLERMQAAFIRPVTMSNTEFYVSISIGVASTNSVDDIDMSIETLIKHADIAMYAAKHGGKKRYYLYDTAMSDKIETEHLLNIEIKRALENDEFELFYQPQVSAADGRIWGVEALIRWNHPQKGFLTPDYFIDAIEKGVHTQAFGEWVIQAAVQQQQYWYQQGIDVSVSINLSVKHVLSPDFFQSITQLICLLQADLTRIHFEITEYEIMSHYSRGIEDLKQLANAGFKLFLDDFGTGYSSISYLEKLPIYGIKIDRSFVRYLDEDTTKKGLVDGILTLAKALNLKVVAEGVETTAQRDFLVENNCDFLQGYLIAKPMKAVDIADFYHRLS